MRAWRWLLCLLLLGTASSLAQTTRSVTVLWDDVIDQGVIYADIEHDNGVVTNCPALYVPEPGARGCNITVPVGTSQWRVRVANVNGYGPWTAYVSITVPPVSSGDPPGPFRLLWHSPITVLTTEVGLMAATVEAYATPAVADWTAAGGTQDFTVDAGSGANRVFYLYSWWRSNRSHAISFTYNGESLTAIGSPVAVTGNTTAQLYRLIAPASGSNTLTITASTGDANIYQHILVAVVQDADQTTPNDTVAHEAESGTDAATTQDIGVTSATGDLVLTFAVFLTGGFDTTGSVSGSSYTLHVHSTHGGAGAGMLVGSAAGAATVTPATTYNNIGDWWAGRLGVNVNTAAAGGQAARSQHQFRMRR